MFDMRNFTSNAPHDHPPAAGKRALFPGSKETIWHFTCIDCKNWWSYSTMENWRPIKPMFCPHCGEKQR